MPILTKEETKRLLEEIKKTLPKTACPTSEEKEFSIKECEDYLNNKNKKVEDMRPLSLFYIISKLNESEQIEFIKNNINYIRKHDEEIFLYAMISPRSLSYYLSFNVLKEIRKLDRQIFKKILNGCYENMFNCLTFEDLLGFLDEFYEDLQEIKNCNFINMLYSYTHSFSFKKDELSNGKVDFNLYSANNKKITDIVIKKYKEKIKTFNTSELLNLIHYIKDIKQFEYCVVENKEKLEEVFKNPERYELYEYLDYCSKEKTEIFLLNFFDIISKNTYMEKTFFHVINTEAIIKLYKQNKRLNISLSDLLMSSAEYGVFNDDLKLMLNEYKIEQLDDIENLFNKNFYTKVLNRNLNALEYVETKFRNNIIADENLEDIDEKTSIFSLEYLKNLARLKYLLKNNYITKDDTHYQKHLKNFVLYLKNNDIVIALNNEGKEEIEKLFYMIVMGKSISILFKVRSIEEIALYNRIGKIDFNVQGLVIEQIKKFNVKEHKHLCNMCEDTLWNFKIKGLILKLMLLVGYNHAKEMLEIDNSITTLEHLVDSVDVKCVKLDESGNPILNDRIINLLFNNKNKNLIKEMFENKESDLYTHFPRIFSEWEMIKANNKDKSLDVIIEYLKADNISLPPEYNRLIGLFKYIGCDNSKVKETFSLHDQMLKRTDSTIPKIKGNLGEYSYEILDLQDMESIVVGNKTNCCFSVLGNGYSCLKHACISKNGRILVIKKNNKLIAHSWIWRNGNLLCLDNIELSQSVNEVNFLDVYLKFAEEVTNKSFENENYDDAIKNVTIGYTNFDKPNEELKKYPCFISKDCDLEKKDFGKRLGYNRTFLNNLPQPIEAVEYSDSRNVQYLIKGTGIFNLGQSEYLYKDEQLIKNKVLTLKKGTN